MQGRVQGQLYTIPAGERFSPDIDLEGFALCGVMVTGSIPGAGNFLAIRNGDGIDSWVMDAAGDARTVVNSMDETVFISVPEWGSRVNNIRLVLPSEAITDLDFYIIKRSPEYVYTGQSWNS